MPITVELIVLMLAAYLAGLAIGWGLWGRAESSEHMGRDGNG